jgi:hypothetical protein
MHRFRLAALVSCAAIAVVSCAPQTTMLNSWTDPNYQPGSIKKVVVLGIAQQAGARRTFEDEFVAALKKMNYDAAVSYTIVPELTPGDSIRIQSTFRDGGFTHVLCTRVIDRKTVETYVPPTVHSVGYSPYYPAYYGSWGAYYSVGYSYAVDPGYVSQDVVVSLETNLYRVDTPGIVWSGLTETWMGSTVESNIHAVIMTTVEELKKDKVL